MFRLLRAELKKIVLNKKFIIGSVCSVIIFMAGLSYLYKENLKYQDTYYQYPNIQQGMPMGWVKDAIESLSPVDFAPKLDNLRLFTEKDSLQLFKETLEELSRINAAVAGTVVGIPNANFNHTVEEVAEYFSRPQTQEAMYELESIVKDAYNTYLFMERIDYKTTVFFDRDTYYHIDVAEPGMPHGRSYAEPLLNIYRWLFGRDIKSVDEYLQLAEGLQTSQDQASDLQLLTGAASLFYSVTQDIKRPNFEFFESIFIESFDEGNMLDKAAGIKFSDERFEYLTEILLGANGAQEFFGSLYDEIRQIWPEGEVAVVNDIEQAQMWLARYSSLSDLARTYIYNYCIVYGLNMDDAQLQKYLYSASNYSLKNKMVFAEYVFENKLYLSAPDTAEGYDHGSMPLSFIGAMQVLAVNSQGNYYHYAEFMLSFLSTVITVICVIIGGGAIAGEHTRGTIKMLVIRPYSRSQILLSKILAILICIVVLSVAATLLTLLIGLILGIVVPHNPVLLVFNAQRVIVMSHFAQLWLSVFFMIFNITVYSLIAVMFSVIIKSRSASVAVAMLLSSLGSLFTMALYQFKVVRYLIFANNDLYGYFGTGSMLMDMSFEFSLIMCLLYCALVLAVSFLAFTKRDLN